MVLKKKPSTRARPIRLPAVSVPALSAARRGYVRSVPVSNSLPHYNSRAVAVSSRYDIIITNVDAGKDINEANEVN
jgi:hypothetical protein